MSGQLSDRRHAITVIVGIAGITRAIGVGIQLIRITHSGQLSGRRRCRHRHHRYHRHHPCLGVGIQLIRC